MLNLYQVPVPSSVQSVVMGLEMVVRSVTQTFPSLLNSWKLHWNHRSIWHHEIKFIASFSHLEPNGEMRFLIHCAAIDQYACQCRPPWFPWFLMLQVKEITMMYASDVSRWTAEALTALQEVVFYSELIHRSYETNGYVFVNVTELRFVFIILTSFKLSVLPCHNQRCALFSTARLLNHQKGTYQGHETVGWHSCLPSYAFSTCEIITF